MEHFIRTTDQEKDLVVAAAEEEEEACKGDLLTRTAKVNMDRITNRVHAAITARLWAILRRIVTRSMAIQAQETRTMTKKEAKQTTPSSLHQNLIPRAFLPSSPTQAQPNTCVIKRDFSQHLNQSRLVTGPCLVKNLFCFVFFFFFLNVTKWNFVSPRNRKHKTGCLGCWRHQRHNQSK